MQSILQDLKETEVIKVTEFIEANHILLPSFRFY